MKSLKKAVVCTSAAVALVLGGVVGVPLAASAASAGSCNAHVTTSGQAQAYCTSGTGDYRVGMSCKPIGPFGFYGYGFTHWGNWTTVGNGIKSVANCPFGSANWSPSGGAYYAYVETR